MTVPHDIALYSYAPDHCSNKYFRHIQLNSNKYNLKQKWQYLQIYKTITLYKKIQRNWKVIKPYQLRNSFISVSCLKTMQCLKRFLSRISILHEYFCTSHMSFLTTQNNGWLMTWAQWGQLITQYNIFLV